MAGRGASSPPVRRPMPPLARPRRPMPPPRRPPSATIGSMPAPDRVEAAAILLSLDPPPWFLRHARAVAEVAGWLALRIVERTTDGETVTGSDRSGVDRALVESAALLHDVDKLLDPSDPVRRLPHGEAAGAWLGRLGWPALGPAVTGHPVTRLADGEATEAWLRDADLETRIVAYADKRAGQRLETVDARFASWARRYPPVDDPDDARTTVDRGRRNGAWDRATMALVRARVGRLEDGVCSAAGIAPAEVRRLAWTGPALRAARDRGNGRPASRSARTGWPA